MNESKKDNGNNSQNLPNSSYKGNGKIKKAPEKFNNGWGKNETRKAEKPSDKK